MAARVLGVGQSLAGDDGVGPAVIRELRRIGVPEGIELVEVVEPCDLVPFLLGSEPVVVVDAVVGSHAPGEVLCLTPEAFRGRENSLLSGHVLNVAEAVELARALSGEGCLAPLKIVAISVGGRARSPALSPAVVAAVPRAAEEVLRLATDCEALT